MLSFLQTRPLRRIFGWRTSGPVTPLPVQVEPGEPNGPTALSDRDRDQAAEVSFWRLAAFPVL
ncbi:hypothetical protein J2858_001886 [Neorhizobium galegae]|nr:hypothetical protein [Neorhizobium galegae]